MVFEDCCLSVMVFFISNKFRTPARWSCLKEMMSKLALNLINLQMELGCREARWLVGLALPPPLFPPLLSLPLAISSFQPLCGLGRDRAEGWGSRCCLCPLQALMGSLAECLVAQTPLTAAWPHIDPHKKVLEVLE